MPPAEKVSKLFFILTILGAFAWFATTGFFVMSKTPTPTIEDAQNAHAPPSALIGGGNK